jgi:hypothetical protein
MKLSVSVTGVDTVVVVCLRRIVLGESDSFFKRGVWLYVEAG